MSDGGKGGDPDHPVAATGSSRSTPESLAASAQLERVDPRERGATASPLDSTPAGVAVTAMSFCLAQISASLINEVLSGIDDR